MWAAMSEIADYGFVVVGLYLLAWKRDIGTGLACLALAKANMAYRLAEKETP